MPLPLRLIFCQSYPDFRGGRNANASKMGVQLTKNLLAKSGTEKFRENIKKEKGEGRWWIKLRS